MEIKSRKVRQILNWNDEAAAFRFEAHALIEKAEALDNTALAYEGTLNGSQFAELQQAKKERGL